MLGCSLARSLARSRQPSSGALGGVRLPSFPSQRSSSPASSFSSWPRIVRLRGGGARALLSARRGSGTTTTMAVEEEGLRVFQSVRIKIGEGKARGEGGRQRPGNPRWSGERRCGRQLAPDTLLRSPAPSVPPGDRAGGARGPAGLCGASGRRSGSGGKRRREGRAAGVAVTGGQRRVRPAGEPRRRESGR